MSQVSYMEERSDSRSRTDSRNRRDSRLIHLKNQESKSTASGERCGIIPKLLPLKLVIFLVYGGFAALYPFFTLHMKSIGITLIQTTVISFLLPILGCIGVAGLLVICDKIGHHKLLVVGLTALHILFHMLLLMIPPARQFETSAPTSIGSVNISFPCDTRRNAIFSVQTQHSTVCDTQNLAVTADARNELQIDSCYTNCQSKHAHEQPSVCFFNATTRDTTSRGHYCAKWYELERQVLQDLVLMPVILNRSGKYVMSWEPVAFHNDEGSPLHTARCLLESQPDPEHLLTSHCSVFCQASTSFVLICNVLHRDKIPFLNLLGYFLLRLFGLICLMTVFVILDSSTVQQVGEHHGKLGFHRLFAALGVILTPPLSGYLLGRVSQSHAVGWVGGLINESKFFPVFALFSTLSATAAIIILCVHVPRDLPRRDIWHNVGILLKNTYILSFLFMMFIIGFGIGYVMSFLLWFLEDELLAPAWVMGAGAGIANLLAVPIISHLSVGAFGFGWVLVTALLLSGFRFLAYAFLYNANLQLTIEILTCLIAAILWAVRGFMFLPSILPKYVSSLHALRNVATLGLGAGVGPLIGGFCIDAYGHRTAFLIMATIFFIMALLFALLYCCFLRKRNWTEGLTAPAEMAELSLSYSDYDYPEDITAILYREAASPTAELEPELQDGILEIYKRGSIPALIISQKFI